VHFTVSILLLLFCIIFAMKYLLSLSTLSQCSSIVRINLPDDHWTLNFLSGFSPFLIYCIDLFYTINYASGPNFNIHSDAVKSCINNICTFKFMSLLLVEMATVPVGTHLVSSLVMNTSLLFMS
jgi:hypothetical protein